MHNPTKFYRLATIICLAATVQVAAQDGSSGIEERLLECDQISDSAAKLACIDVVIKGIKQDETSDTSASGEPIDELSEPDPPPAPAGAVTAGAAGAATIPEEVIPEPSETPIMVDEKPSPEQEDAAAPADATDEFGLEDQIAEEQKEELKRLEEEVDEIRATIVDSWVTIDRRFEVLLDNGQIWRETELTRTPRLPKAGSAVRITRASMGSFRMKIGNNNRLAAVRRTR